jgi:hypothetical protein
MVIILISTALILDSNIRNSVCTPAKLPCRRVVEGNNNHVVVEESVQRRFSVNVWCGIFGGGFNS